MILYTASIGEAQWQRKSIQRCNEGRTGHDNDLGEAYSYAVQGLNEPAGFGRGMPSPGILMGNGSLRLNVHAHQRANQ